MTRDEVMALEAGPELDALVAEKVMGWHRAACSNWTERRSGQPWLDVDSLSAANPFWSPSTDIAAAWEVVEKVRGWKPKVRGNTCACFAIDAPAVTGGLEKPAVWAAGWHDYAGWERAGSLEATADTAPLAICRVSLLALESR